MRFMPLPGLRKRPRKLARAGSDDERVVQLIVAHGVDAVLDVGANVGQYAGRLRAAGYAGPIVSVEPGSDAHAVLVAAAASDPGWRVAPRMALGAAAGEAVLHLADRSDMNALAPMTAATRAAFPKATDAGTEPVTVARLDAVFDEIAGREAARAFLKIDAQGAERDIIEGAAGVIGRIAGLQLELSLVPLYEGEARYLEILTAVEAMGFALHLVIPGHFSRRLGRQLQFDGVFFRS